MTLLEQCQIWHKNDEYQKIIDTLEAIPAQERTAEMDSELAPGLQQSGGPHEAGGPEAAPKGHRSLEAS